MNQSYNPAHLRRGFLAQPFLFYSINLKSYVKIHNNSEYIIQISDQVCVCVCVCVCTHDTCKQFSRSLSNALQAVFLTNKNSIKQLVNSTFIPFISDLESTLHSHQAQYLTISIEIHNQCIISTTIRCKLFLLAGSPSYGGNVAVYVFDINQLSLPTPFYSVLVSISVFVALSTVFHSINSPDNSPLSHSVLPVLFLPRCSFQLYISLYESLLQP